MKKKLIPVFILLALMFGLMWVLGCNSDDEEIAPHIITPIPDKEIETDW